MDELIPWAGASGAARTGRAGSRAPGTPKAARGRRPYRLATSRCCAYGLRAVALQPERPWDGGSAVRGLESVRRFGAGTQPAAARVRCRTRRRSCTSGTCWSATVSGKTLFAGVALVSRQRAPGVVARQASAAGLVPDDRHASIVAAPSSTKNRQRARDPARDASDAHLWQAVELRHEGAHRRGLGVGLDARPGDDGGER